MADARGGATANEVLLDRAISHAVYFQRLKTGTVRQIVGTLNADVLRVLERDIAAALARGEGDETATSRRLQAVHDVLREVAYVGFEEVRRRLASALGGIATYEAEWQVATLRGAFPPISVTFNQPSPVLLRSIVETRPFEGRVLSQWWSGVAADAQVRIVDVVQEGLATGRTTREIVARITGDETIGDAPFAATRRNVEAVVRTASQEVATSARAMTYAENSDLIKGWQFVATLDSRTTLICASQDGRVYAVGEGRPPPLHFGCRSTTVPVLKSLEELGFAGRDIPPGTRSSLDGAVAEKTDYDAWLRRQPQAVQVEALGPERANLFRGGLRIDRFVDDRLRVLSLEELRALENVGGGA